MIGAGGAGVHGGVVLPDGGVTKHMGVPTVSPEISDVWCALL